MTATKTGATECFSLEQFLGSWAQLFSAGSFMPSSELTIFENYVVPALPGVAILLVAFIWQSVRREWKWRRDRLKNGALSRDELLKARSKLRNSMSPPRQAEVNMPDIDLKY